MASRSGVSLQRQPTPVWSERLIAVRYPDGDVLGPIEYDQAGHVRSIPWVVTGVTYDAAGRPLVQTNANGTTTTRTWNAARGWLESIVTTSASAGVLVDLHYTDYDDLGLLRQVTSGAPGDGWRYEYDEGYRLTLAENLTSNETQTWQYDVAGRISYNSRLGTYDYGGITTGEPPHAPRSVGTNFYSYDPNGNLASGGGRTPTWDAENRLQSLNGTSFSYDHEGERVKKTGPNGTSLYPFGDDYEITNGVTTKYVSVEGLGVVAKGVKDQYGAQPYWLHTDRLGSIKAVTNAQGTQELYRDYRPYGEVASQSGSHTESRGWIDQRTDGESGLTYLHARYFDPQLGIFLSPDPIGVDGGLNQYGYGHGNPIRWTDRTGLASVYQCRATPPSGAGCGTDPRCVSPSPGVECWYSGEAETVTVTAPAPPPDDSHRGDSDGQHQDGYGRGGPGPGWWAEPGWRAEQRKRGRRRR